jgi:hypothetical protein
MENVKTRPIEVCDKSMEVLLHINPDRDSALKRPSTNNYYVIPEKATSVRPLFQSFHWNCATKTINVVIDESPDFAAYRWFSKTAGLTDNNVVLVMFDGKNQEIARIKFSGLKLTSHSCGLNYANVPTNVEDDTIDCVSHHIEFVYNAENMAFPDDLQANAVEGNVDDDWLDEDLVMKLDETVDKKDSE